MDLGRAHLYSRQSNRIMWKESSAGETIIYHRAPRTSKTLKRHLRDVTLSRLRALRYQIRHLHSLRNPDGLPFIVSRTLCQARCEGMIVCRRLQYLLTIRSPNTLAGGLKTKPAPLCQIHLLYGSLPSRANQTLIVSSRVLRLKRPGDSPSKAQPPP